MGAEWVKRPFVAAEDMGALVYMWCASYMRSHEGIERGAFAPHGRADAQSGIPEVRKNAKRFWAEIAPLVVWLLHNETTEVICDPERVRSSDEGPAVIWAFACTTGHFIHCVSVKRKMLKVPNLGRDMVRDLLGERLRQPCQVTHELPELEFGKLGLDIPRQWKPSNPMWLPRHMARSLVDETRAEAA
jgi:hypothetical protein